MTHVVFLTLGSQGDLQPLIVLAANVKQRLGATGTTTMVSPEDLQAPYTRVLEEYAIQRHGLAIPIVPAVDGNAEKSQARQAECKALWGACQTLKPTLIVLTTFTLEGWSIAERLGVPCMVVSLFLVDLFAMPPPFESALATELPEIHAALEKAPVWQQHVSHWMWRMFLDDHGEFRESLGLDAIPRLDFEAQPLPLLYGLDPHFCTSPDPAVARMLGFWMDADVLMAMSAPLFDAITKTDAESAMTRLGAFVKKAHTHRRKLIHVGFGSMLARHPRLRLETTLLKALFMAINTAALKHDASVVWVIDSLTPAKDSADAHAYCLQAAVAAGEDRVHVHPQTIPHDFLFRLMLHGLSSAKGLPLDFKTWWEQTRPTAASLPERAHVVGIHHGGAGTFACMALYCLPQIIMPLMFDQHYWSNKAEETGLGRRVSLCHATDPQSWNLALGWALANNEKQRHLQQKWQKDIHNTTREGLKEATRLLHSRIDMSCL